MKVSKNVLDLKKKALAKKIAKPFDLKKDLAGYMKEHASDKFKGDK